MHEIAFSKLIYAFLAAFLYFLYPVTIYLPQLTAGIRKGMFWKLFQSEWPQLSAMSTKLNVFCFFRNGQSNKQHFLCVHEKANKNFLGLSFFDDLPTYVLLLTEWVRRLDYSVASKLSRQPSSCDTFGEEVEPPQLLYFYVTSSRESTSRSLGHHALQPHLR